MLVVYRKSEHSPQLADTFRLIFLIGMDDHFGIAVCGETVATFLEFCSQFTEVVNFSVENNPDRFVFVVNRLVSAGQVDDAQSPHSQGDVISNEYALVVRPSVENRLAHPMSSCVVGSNAIEAQYPGYAAHVRLISQPADHLICSTNLF